MNYLNYSSSESSICGLRIGRSVLIDRLDPAQLLDEIFALDLDVCKLKLNLEDPEVYDKLDKLHMPYEIYSVLARQTIDLTSEHAAYTPALKFVLYTSELKPILTEALNKILPSNTGVYYKSDLYNGLFPGDSDLNAFREYYYSFDNDVHTSRYLFLAYFEEVCVGFFCMEKHETEMEVLMMGVIPEYRNRKFSHDISRFVHKSSAMLNCTKLSENSVLLNPRSINTTLKTGMTVSGAYLNVNIFPLLNKNNFEVGSVNCTPSEIISKIKQFIREIPALQQKKIFIHTVKTNIDKAMAHTYKITIPYTDDHSMLAVATGDDRSYLYAQIHLH